MIQRQFTFNDVQWDLVPKVEDERFIPIYSAVAQHTYDLVIVCPRMITAGTHYLDKRTIPCIGEGLGCEGCKVKRQLRVKGYLGCWEPQFSRLVMAELTHEAMITANVDLQAPKESLRGLWLKLWRIGKAPQSPVRCEVYGRERVQDLPAEFDVRAALLRVWNGKNRPK